MSWAALSQSLTKSRILARLLDKGYRYVIHPAETAAGLTSASLAFGFKPGDLRRYATFRTGGGDVTAALANACAQAQQPGGAPVYVPGSMGALTVTAGVTLNSPVTIYGDGQLLSVISTANDISVLTFNLGASRSIVRDVQLIGKGAGATLAGVLYTDANNCLLQGVRVRNFGIGVQYAKGANSCYLNAMRDCIIENNITDNINAQANTNALHLYHCQFGGSAQRGIYIVDSNNLQVYGGDCEGVTVCAIDLDATVELRANHLISGVHFESNTSSAGDIRIGLTAAVDGVAVLGCLFKPAAGDAAAINAVNCNGLCVIGHLQIGGYTTVPFLMRTNLTGEVMIPASTTADNMPAYIADSFKTNYADAAALTWSPASNYDPAIEDYLAYSLYKIKSSSIAANKNYYGRLDVVRADATGAIAAGSKVYVYGAIPSNAAGGATKFGAIYAGGDVDIAGALAPSNFGAVQAGAIYMGAGGPAAGNGNNGDVYLNTTGGAGTTIYQKRAGAWVGVA